MSSSGGEATSTRVSNSIPNNMKKTIHNIKEITGNHTEEDIYAMLKECSMDPNETTQRLLHLDSFQEVKSKRDKRKETGKANSSEEHNRRYGYPGQGTRSARGNYFPQHNSKDGGGRRNAFFRKENGVEESREKGFRHPPGALKEADSVRRHHVEKSSSITLKGPVKVANGSVSGVYNAKSALVGNAVCSQENVGAVADSLSATKSNDVVEVAPSASDPVLVPAHNSQIPTAVGTIKREARTHQISAEAISHTESGPGNTVPMSNSHLKQPELHTVSGSKVSSLPNKIELFMPENVAQAKSAGECPVDKFAAVKPSSTQGVEHSVSRMEKLKFSDGQHVIIPNHIQVPDEVKNALKFGSLNASFGVSKNQVNAESIQNLDPVADSAPGEGADALSSCGEDELLAEPQAEHVEHQHSQVLLPAKDLPVDTNVSSSPLVQKVDFPKEENLPAVGPPFPVVQTSPSYSFGFMPPMLANTLVQQEGFESQAHSLNSSSGSSLTVSTPSSTPPLSGGAGQSSVPFSSQTVPLFRQPFPHNFVPYGHYFSPYFVPPMMHQYYGHTAFPAPLPTGNAFIQPTAATGMKISPAHNKPGPNSGNQVPAGVPSGYGMYNTSQVGFNSNGAVTSGNSSSSEDRTLPVLKDSNGYTAQQSEASAVWLPATGRDQAGFPLNSFVSLLPPQGQHVISSQSGHSPFPIYHTLQPMPTPPTPPGLPLLQQSQPVAGPVDSGGPPSNAFQQSQRQQQTNWNI